MLSFLKDWHLLGCKRASFAGGENRGTQRSSQYWSCGYSYGYLASSFDIKSNQNPWECWMDDFNARDFEASCIVKFLDDVCAFLHWGSDYASVNHDQESRERAMIRSRGGIILVATINWSMTKYSQGASFSLNITILDSD